MTLSLSLCPKMRRTFRLGNVLPAIHLSLSLPPSIRSASKRDHSQDVRCNVQRFKFALCSVSNPSCNFLPSAADAKHDFNFICVLPMPPRCADCLTFCPESNGISCRLREISSLSSKKQYQYVEGWCAKPLVWSSSILLPPSLVISAAAAAVADVDVRPSLPPPLPDLVQRAPPSIPSAVRRHPSTP